ncbi:TPA: hypothetical protein VJO57_001107 [Streptococcus pyogenes]|nr:hypothetical protein [Streptococcus pyogenes]
MKTKSKRFLNLATLCLALLGTTLLMTHPVKAEAEAEAEVQSISRDTDTGLKDTIRERYMGEMGISSDDLERQSDYKNRFEGYFKGYSDGLNGCERPERDKIEVPSEYSGGQGDTEYRDGYEGGFEEGRRENYPVQAFLEQVWGFLTSIFHDWFGDGAKSQ